MFENVTYEASEAGYLKIPTVVMFHYSASSEKGEVSRSLMHNIYYNAQNKEFLIYDFPA
jgi:hypothetical protein